MLGWSSWLAGLLMAPVLAQAADGVWLSQGYGYAFQIAGAKLQVFEVTSRTCALSTVAKLEPGKRDSYAAKGGDRFVVLEGESTDQRLLNRGGGTNLRIVRAAGLPARCNPATGNTTLANFDVFARTWAEHYIGFDSRRVDWDRLVEAQGAKIGAATTSGELFELMQAMIQPLRDLHTYLAAPGIKREFEGEFRRGSDRVIASPSKAFATHGRRTLFLPTDRALRGARLTRLCRGQFLYGWVDDRIGYLRILAFGGFRAADLETALDKIFSPAALQALVVDVRLSFGGDDGHGIAIARRLADTEYLAYAKQARWGSEWTAPDPVMVRPSARARFLGPVVVLTSPITMSAAETFTMALMGRRPSVVRIGENTQGVFSDVLDRKLPNGWSFGLPNEVYRTAGGGAFDVEGIPPDIRVPGFLAEDLAAGLDPALMKAASLLRETLSRK